VTTIEALNERGVGKLPGFLGVVFTRLDGAEIEAELPVRAELMAPNGFLHAGSIVTLADTSCGYGCFANLPQGATGFTTIELKSNHLGTTREGTWGGTPTSGMPSSRTRNPIGRSRSFAAHR